jgi:hypothetical protein
VLHSLLPLAAVFGCYFSKAPCSLTRAVAVPALPRPHSQDLQVVLSTGATIDKQVLSLIQVTARHCTHTFRQTQDGESSAQGRHWASKSSEPTPGQPPQGTHTGPGEKQEQRHGSEMPGGQGHCLPELPGFLACPSAGRSCW